jgi:predicted enzyme related to lactoylglutathione lyase
MSAAAGNFVWYELMTPDPKKAAAFYRAVIGWQSGDAGMSGGDYTIFSAGAGQVAGLMGMPPQAVANGAPAGWRGYLAVHDTDAVAARVAAAGGVVRYGPADIPGVGRVASVTDPQGAAFLLFTPTPGSARPEFAPGTPGTIGWHELAAADQASAFDFYAGLFGWTKSTVHDMGPAGTYQLFAVDGADAGGMMTRMDPTAPPHWTYYVVVEAATAAAARIESAGGKVTHGPTPVPGGSWVVQATDGQGLGFAVVAPAP